MNTALKEAYVLDSLKMHFKNFFRYLDDICMHRSSDVVEALFKSNIICYSFLYTNMAANYDPFNARIVV